MQIYVLDNAFFVEPHRIPDSNFYKSDSSCPHIDLPIGIVLVFGHLNMSMMAALPLLILLPITIVVYVLENLWCHVVPTRILKLEQVFFGVYVCVLFTLVEVYQV